MNEKYGYSAAEERSRSSVLGMPVVSINEGLVLGEVKQILLDGGTYRVQGFLVEKKHSGRDDRILPFSAVHSFGSDGITVKQQAVLERKGASHQYIRSLRQPLSVIGARVFTAGGSTLGKVEEYRFSIADGSITGIEIKGGLFKKKMLTPGRHIIAISPQTVMLKEAAIDDADDIEEKVSAARHTDPAPAAAVNTETRPAETRGAEIEGAPEPEATVTPDSGIKTDAAVKTGPRQAPTDRRAPAIGISGATAAQSTADRAVGRAQESAETMTITIIPAAKLTTAEQTPETSAVAAGQLASAAAAPAEEIIYLTAEEDRIAQPSPAPGAVDAGTEADGRQTPAAAGSSPVPQPAGAASSGAAALSSNATIVNAGSSPVPQSAGASEAEEAEQIIYITAEELAPAAAAAPEQAAGLGGEVIYITADLVSQENDS